MKIELELPEEDKRILKSINDQLSEIKKEFEPKRPPKYIPKSKVADMLDCSLSTVHNLTVQGMLKKHGIGGRVLYILEEVEAAIIPL